MKNLESEEPTIDDLIGLGSTEEVTNSVDLKRELYECDEICKKD